MKWKNSLLIGMVAVSISITTTLHADMITIGTDKDNTLYEHATGLLSDGAGTYFFVGRTGQPAGLAIRRGVLSFDVAGNIPAGSTINSVELKLHMSKTRSSATQATELHRITSDWGEGTSNAAGQEGSGAPASTGDATWIHQFYDTDTWDNEGGDFMLTVSGSTNVTSTGFYTWTTTPQMVSDVQDWLSNPASNFGWIVLGDEFTNFSANRYDTKENATPANRPSLTIDYSPPVISACCNTTDATCEDGLELADCNAVGKVWTDGVFCADLDPPCTAITGACCNEANGLCFDDFTQENCDILGRRYGGDFSSCDTLNPPCIQPVNPPVPIGLELIADSLAAPIYLTHAGDGSGRLFIVDQAGLIRVVKNGTLLPTPFLDVTDRMIEINTGYDERGLLGIAFHPDYSNNGRFFIRYSKPRTGDSGEPCFGTARGCHEEILSEFQVLGDPATSDIGDPTSESILYQVDEPQFNHNAGQVAFGPDGLLYWTLGDGGGANDGLSDVPPSHGANGNGQNPQSALGNLMRIDVDSTPDIVLPYAVPAGNPFADGIDGLPEIYAYGLRNPYRFSFDSGPGGDGSLYMTDVGQALFEEVSVLPVLASPPLYNMGWVIREGFNCFDPLNPSIPPVSCTNLGPLGETMIEPVIAYDHNIGIAIIGGYVYRGSAYPPLQGKYVYGDWFATITGSFFYSDLTGPDAFVRQEFFIAPEGDPLTFYLLGMGEDEEGELYALTSTNIGPSGTDGKVYKIVPPSPIVEPAGSRYIAITIPPSSSPMGLVVRRGCDGETTRYLDNPSGPHNIALAVENPVDGAFLNSNDWGIVVNVTGLDITSNTDYEVQIDYGTLGTPTLSSTEMNTTYVYGDVTQAGGGLPDGTPAVVDILAIVDGWLGSLKIPLLRLDIKSAYCMPDQVINILDILQSVDAWLGTPDPCDTLCP